MSQDSRRYCLDSNVLIEAWRKYYNPAFCAQYWEALDELGKRGSLFIPKAVFEEIARAEDDLAVWLTESNISKVEVDEPVTLIMRDILQVFPQLVDSTKQRSLADPWVIAHALKEGAVLVTKEEKPTAANSKKVKIPHVCEAFDVRWMNDFDMIQALGIRFGCTLV